MDSASCILLLDIGCILKMVKGQKEGKWEWMILRKGGSRAVCMLSSLLASWLRMGYTCIGPYTLDFPVTTHCSLESWAEMNPLFLQFHWSEYFNQTFRRRKTTFTLQMSTEPDYQQAKYLFEFLVFVLPHAYLWTPKDAATVRKSYQSIRIS